MTQAIKFGSGTPIDELGDGSGVNGIAGDVYVDLDTSDVWSHTGSAWTNLGSTTVISTVSFQDFEVLRQTVDANATIASNAYVGVGAYETFKSNVEGQLAAITVANDTVSETDFNAYKNFIQTQLNNVAANSVTEAEFEAFKVQIQALLDTVALQDVVDQQLVIKANIAQVNTALGTKADLATTQAELALKADKAVVDLELSKKVNNTDLSTALALKADAATVAVQISDKVTQAELAAALADFTPATGGIDLSLKADKAYVDERLALKANASSLAGKANITYVDDIAATKADVNTVAAKADKTYVDGVVAPKADKTYVDQQLANVIAGGAGSVTSVAGRTGVITLTTNDVAETANKRYVTDAERVKLGSVASGATANSSDAALRDRQYHTGSQDISTIANLQTTLDSKASIAYVDGKLVGVLTQADFDLATDNLVTDTELASTLTSYTSLVKLDQELNKKANTTHTHAISDVTGLATELASKLSSGQLTSALESKADVTTVTSKLDRSLVLDDVAKPSVILGTVHASRWSGLTVGQNLSSAQRQANLAALQEAVNYAADNNKFFELDPGFYEIEGEAGLVIPHGGPFTWRGQMGAPGYSGTSIKKFKTGTGNMGPILRVGGHAGDKAEHLDFKGVALCYGSNVTADATAVALLVGDMYKGHIEQVDITSNWNNQTNDWDYAPFIGVKFDDSHDRTGYFSSVMKTINVKGAQQNLMAARLTGTGNTFENIYLSNGVAGLGVRPLSGQALYWSTEAAAQYGNVWSQLNIEWTRANRLAQFSTCYATVIDGLHFEGNESSGMTPCFIDAVGSGLTIRGMDVLQHRFHTAYGMDASTTGYIFRSWGGSRIDVNMLDMQLDIPGNINLGWRFIREFEPSGNYTPRVKIENFSIKGTDYGTFSPDENFDPAVFHDFKTFQKYEYGKRSSIVTKPVIDVDGSFNVFTQYEDPEYVFPAAPSSDSYVTLMNRSKYAGDLHMVPPRIGATVRVRRENGTVNSARIIVKSYTGDVLATMIDAGDDLTFRWDGKQWHDAAQEPPPLFSDTGSDGTTVINTTVVAPDKVLVGQRCSLPSRSYANPSPGSHRQVATNSRYRIVEDCSDVEVIWDNIQRDGFGAYAAGASAATVKMAAPKVTGGNALPLIFQNGNLSTTVDPDGRARAFHGTPVKAGEYLIPINVTYATAPDTFTASDFATWESGESNTTGTAGSLYDNTTNTAFSVPSIATKTSNYVPLPLTAILGRPVPGAAKRARVAVLGDSITSAGSNDSQTTIGTIVAPGYMLRYLTEANVPYINIGCEGLSLNDVVNTHSDLSKNRRMRAIQNIGITHCFVMLGQNDQAQSRTSEQYITDLIKLRDQLKLMGIKLIAQTSFPRTNAANTAANATGSWTEASAITSYIRANNGVGDGYVDVAAIFGQSANQNLWRTDQGGVPTDGIHPGAALHTYAKTQLIAAVPNLIKV